MPCASRLATLHSAVAIALALVLAAQVQAQPVNKAKRANPPPAPQSAVAAPAPPASTGSTEPPCAELGKDAPQMMVVVGKTARYQPLAPVVSLILSDPPGSGVIGARSANPADAQPASSSQAAAGQPGGSASVNFMARPAPDSQQVSERPGAGAMDVRLLSKTDVYVTGRKIGSANVVLLHADRKCTMLNVVIAMDPDPLQAAIERLLPDEKDKIDEKDRVRVSAAFDSLVLKGTVSDTEALTRVTDLANAYLRGGEGGNGGAAKNPRIVNMLEVGAPQQVMLEVKVAEISKNLLDQFGIDFSRAYVPGDGSMVRFLSGIFGGASAAAGQISGTNQGVPRSSVDAVVGGSVSGTGGNASTGSSLTAGNVTVTYDQNNRPTYTTTYGTVPGRGVTNLGLNMQKTDGLVKVLAEPSIMAISGQTGSFLAGGKIFIPVASTTEGGARVVTLEEKEFGVSVSFTPTVLGGGRINLRVRPEVSELNSSGVTIAGVAGTAVLPSFTSRRASTTVQLMDGQSFAIGGLIKNNTTTSIKAFPFLGELPVLGVLFRSTEFQTDRSELVFVITPRLVKPLPADYRLPTDGYVPPTRKELILDGRLEGKAPAEAPPAAAMPAKPPAGGGFDMQTKEVRP
jgi:pilus assembly protein CpaC